MKAVSIRQPWAWLIVNGHKDIENRDWPTKHRGPLLIHAGKSPAAPEAWKNAERLCKRLGIDQPDRHDLSYGGIVGRVDVVDCVEKSKSPWFGGTYGFVLRNARRLRFRPVKGQLGLFSVDRAKTKARAKGRRRKG
jgi:hypothetical protein